MTETSAAGTALTVRGRRAPATETSPAEIALNCHFISRALGGGDSEPSSTGTALTITGRVHPVEETPSPLARVHPIPITLAPAGRDPTPTQLRSTAPERSPAR